MSIHKEATMSNINVDGQGVAELSKKCQELLSIRDEIGNLQKTLNDKMKDEEHMSGTVIPNMMTEIGIRSFTLDDGSTVKVQKKYRPHISDDNRSDAMEWLRANNHEDLIRNEISIPFTKGEDAKAKALEKLIRQSEELRDIVLNKKENVHWKTLSAFCKEQVEKGIDFPEHLFGLFIQDETQIKGGKDE
jgi:hypothetical protein